MMNLMADTMCMKKIVGYVRTAKMKEEKMLVFMLVSVFNVVFRETKLLPATVALAVMAKNDDRKWLPS